MSPNNLPKIHIVDISYYRVMFIMFIVRSDEVYYRSIDAILYPMHLLLAGYMASYPRLVVQSNAYIFLCSGTAEKNGVNAYRQCTSAYIRLQWNLVWKKYCILTMGSESFKWSCFLWRIERYISLKNDSYSIYFSQMNLREELQFQSLHCPFECPSINAQFSPECPSGCPCFQLLTVKLVCVEE